MFATIRRQDHVPYVAHPEQRSQSPGNGCDGPVPSDRAPSWAAVNQERFDLTPGAADSPNVGMLFSNDARQKHLFQQQSQRSTVQEQQWDREAATEVVVSDRNGHVEDEAHVLQPFSCHRSTDVPSERYLPWERFCLEKSPVTLEIALPREPETHEGAAAASPQKDGLRWGSDDNAKPQKDGVLFGRDYRRKILCRALIPEGQSTPMQQPAQQPAQQQPHVDVSLKSLVHRIATEAECVAEASQGSDTVSDLSEESSLSEGSLQVPRVNHNMKQAHTILDARQGALVIDMYSFHRLGNGRNLDAVWSVGSAAHGTGTCKPCLYHSTVRGCSCGRDCEWCHMPHRLSSIRTLRSRKQQARCEKVLWMLNNNQAARQRNDVEPGRSTQRQVRRRYVDL